MDPIVLACAVELEAAPLRVELEHPEAVTIGRRRGWTGVIAHKRIMLVECGMGKTNAAHALTLALERDGASRIIGFGVGGAYPGSKLEVGDIALAESEIYGDEGVETPDGWLSCREIGIPLHEAPGQRHFNTFPVDLANLDAAAEAIRRRGHTLRRGPFVTVSCCSGRVDQAEELARRHAAICETMEGAAYAHLATMYGVPYLEVRGISNLAEDRDLSRWDLNRGAIAAADGVAAVVKAL